MTLNESGWRLGISPGDPWSLSRTYILNSGDRISVDLQKSVRLQGWFSFVTNWNNKNVGIQSWVRRKMYRHIILMESAILKGVSHFYYAFELKSQLCTKLSIVVSRHALRRACRKTTIGISHFTQSSLYTISASLNVQSRQLTTFFQTMEESKSPFPSASACRVMNVNK